MAAATARSKQVIDICNNLYFCSENPRALQLHNPHDPQLSNRRIQKIQDEAKCLTKDLEKLNKEVLDLTRETYVQPRISDPRFSRDFQKLNGKDDQLTKKYREGRNFLDKYRPNRNYSVRK